MSREVIKCVECRYWQKLEGEGYSPHGEAHCLLYAPRAIDSQGWGRQPKTRGSRGCAEGEYKTVAGSGTVEVLEDA